MCGFLYTDWNSFNIECSLPGDMQLVVLEGVMEDNLNTEFHISRTSSMIEELKTHTI